MAKYEPTDTLVWAAYGVTMSQAMCAALLEFASYDETRPHLCGVGVSDGQLAATDGHTLLRYDAPQCEPVRALPLHGKVWSRSYVTMALALAKLEKRDVVLKFDGMLVHAQFPPIAQVVPEPGFGKGTSLAINPEYLARLVKVAKACQNQGVLLTSMRGELDPVMYQCSGRRGVTLEATVVIMPMRY